MSKSVNQVILLGRITRDVELKTTPSGKNVADFSLAVSKSAEESAFFDCVAWDKTAELMSQYTKKGSKVLVQGRLDQQSWDDKETGKKRSKVVIVAFDVTFLDAKEAATTGGEVLPNDEDVAKPLDLSEIPF